MSLAPRRDTGPEMALRRVLHAAGMRYRVGVPVPGQKRRTIDVAFTRAQVAVFVDGCFWHGCPQHGRAPEANSTWWATKLGANQARDRDTDRLLVEAGWTVVRVWEHEDPHTAARRVQAALRPPR
ncbi:MAG: very short patch repair endonuclease [Micrococcales bacterium]|nr:very short patch repair endonuclease [Micrococcales bacterium]MCL2668253.1 very short patch repair endonuclease [Micrococcales bacterium]